MRRHTTQQNQWFAWMKSLSPYTLTWSARPMAPGKLRRPDNEYKRCGTANVFCAVEPKAGTHFTLVTPNRSAPQLAQTLEKIITGYPNADTITSGHG
jgi:hypothetical protein